MKRPAIGERVFNPTLDEIYVVVELPEYAVIVQRGDGNFYIKHVDNLLPAPLDGPEPGTDEYFFDLRAKNDGQLP